MNLRRRPLLLAAHVVVVSALYAIPAIASVPGVILGSVLFGFAEGCEAMGRGFRYVFGWYTSRVSRMTTDAEPSEAKS